MTLSPGERIEVKKAIADALGRQEWRDIDLTLHEFGFPTTDQWEGGNDPSDYVLDMLRASDDQALLQLQSYLRPTAVEAAGPQPEAFDDPANPWSGIGFRLFLSHISRYAEQAGALRAELAKRSVDAFVAHDAINATEEWEDVIRYALRSCDACLALLTPGFRESDWTDQEVGFCLARNLLVIPLEFGQTPYGFLARVQALPVKKGQSQADISLAVFELLARKPESRDAMARALVQRWANTTSWGDARENYGFLKMIPPEAWNQQLVNEVWNARDRVHDLETANINWQSSDVALANLFTDLPFTRPAPPRSDDDIPF